MLSILLAVVAAYIIGSFPTSYLMGLTKGIDVRKEGSGNAGATNVLRVVGKLPALIVLIVDIAKGIIVVTFIASFFYPENALISFDTFRASLGLSVIAGHIWSVFLKFKGGKGVATTCGVLAALLPIPMLIGGVAFIITLIYSKYVSLASLTMLIIIPIITALMGKNFAYVIFAVTICIIISYKHRSNIYRLLAGTENKIFKK